MLPTGTVQSQIGIFAIRKKGLGSISVYGSLMPVRQSCYQRRGAGISATGIYAVSSATGTGAITW